MKMFRRITIGMVLAGVASPSFAGSVDREDLAQCKAALKKVYGEESRMKLKSLKRQRGGDHMRIQAITNSGEDYINNCWVDDEGGVNLEDSQGMALVAPEYDVTDKVTINQ